MEEIWKDIKGYEGLYQVSNLGRVKRILFKNNKFTMHKEKILKYRLTKAGYCRVGLYIDGKGKDYAVHRLVAQAFISNPEKRQEINHIDGNKENNSIRNLEWVTRAENNKHAFTIGLKKPLLGNKNPRTKKIIQYDIKMNKIAEYDSIRELERIKGYGHSSIILCCKGKVNTAYGYIWKYKEEQYFGGNNERFYNKTSF